MASDIPSHCYPAKPTEAVLRSCPGAYLRYLASVDVANLVLGGCGSVVGGVGRRGSDGSLSVDESGASVRLPGLVSCIHVGSGESVSGEAGGSRLLGLWEPVRGLEQWGARVGHSEEDVGCFPGLSSGAGGCGSGAAVDTSRDTVSVERDVEERVVGDCGSAGCDPVESTTERNRRWRQERKDRKKKRQAMLRDWRRGGHNLCPGAAGTFSSSESEVTGGVGSGRVSELRQSLEKKWRVENELAVEKAERKLAVLRANDVAEESKQYRARVLASTEKTKVSIERAYAELASHGDVPGVVGSAETVVSGDGVPGPTKGSISPNSSASMAEFHAQQKALFDTEARVKELEDKLAKVSLKVGFDCTLIDYMDKKTWTDTSENHEILGRLMPGGYGIEEEGMPAGKFKPMYCGSDWY